MYEYMPWKFSRESVSLEHPYTYGGPFDILYPALAIKRVKPDHFVSNFMEIMSGHDTLGFAPLKSARISLGIDSFVTGPGTLVYNSEILEPLREMVSRTLSTRLEVNKEK